MNESTLFIRDFDIPRLDRDIGTAFVLTSVERFYKDIGPRSEK
jgi:hypothetical protein